MWAAVRISYLCVLRALKTLCNPLHQYARLIRMVTILVLTPMGAPVSCTGQANYGWGNMVCEMLCESRRRAGRPGLAVSWGAVAGVGYLEEVLKVLTFTILYPCITLFQTAHLDTCRSGVAPKKMCHGPESVLMPANNPMVPDSLEVTRGPFSRGQGKLVGRKFEINPPQPIDDCLLRLGQFLCGGSRLSPMMVRSSISSPACSLPCMLVVAHCRSHCSQLLLQAGLHHMCKKLNSTLVQGCNSTVNELYSSKGGDGDKASGRPA